jgi:hypothetical protein
MASGVAEDEDKQRSLADSKGKETRRHRSADVNLVSLSLSILVLHGKFGFGKERLTRFSEEFAQTIKDYRNRYDEVALDALISHAKSKGIEVDWV